MKSPLEDIEERQGQVDIGKIGSRMYRGARAEGLSRIDSMFVTMSWFGALLRSSNEEDQQEQDTE